jgi:hypothetical protein
MSQLTSIVNNPYRYVNSLTFTWTSRTQGYVNPGQCRDSTNNFDMYAYSGITLNLASEGLGGLDQGVLVANQSYSIYLVANIENLSLPSVVASLTSSIGPFLPVDYQVFRRIGYFTTDGSALVNTYLMSGYSNDKIINLDQQFIISVASNSSAYTTLPLDTNFPQFVGLVGLISIAGISTGSPATPMVMGIRATGVLTVGPNTSCFLTNYSNNNIGSPNGVAYQTAPAPVITGGTNVPSIDYSCNSAYQIRIAGWIDSL